MDSMLLAARLLLAAVFAVAGVAKLVDLAGSRRAMRDFGLPDRLAAPLGTLLPLAELAAAVALVPARDAHENARAMAESLARVRTGGVARAARDDGHGRFRTGDAVGYVEEELVAWGEPETTLREVLTRLGAGAELLTAIRGREAPLDDVALSALAPDGVELECSEGGQPSWWWLLAAE